MMKKALITGITGQDGSYLAELLLQKGYEVHGIVRRTSTFNRERIEHLSDPNSRFEKIGEPILHYGDLTDASSIENIIKKIMPDEIYNLAAQSHVGISFEVPESTTDIAALGTLRLLEAIRKVCPQAKFYQASSSEMFGEVGVPQNEGTPFNPQSPYACAKVYAYNITRNYRKAHNLFATNGILFNHESERRGENFVTRKITRSLARIKVGLQSELSLGNLEAKRDWGHARDYVKAMWLILQQDKAQDFVIGTGESHSVREFLEEASQALGMPLRSNGLRGADEHYSDENGKVVVRISPKYLRPSEVNYLLADPTKAKTILGWQPEVLFKDLVKIMIEHDLKLAENEAYLKNKEANKEKIAIGEKVIDMMHPFINSKEKS